MNRRWSAALVLCLIALAAHPAWAKKKKDDDAKKDEKPKWNVEQPPGEWTAVPIDTTETTWTNLDVSPDGKTIVFDCLGDLYTLPIEGGEATALTSGIAWDMQPRYSPDGRRIAFVSDRGGASNFWLIDADGKQPKALTEEKEHLVHNPWWSRDGEYVLGKKDFTSSRSIAAGEIWMFHVGGGGGVQLVERPLGEKDQKNIAEPTFSPDGRYVYYSQDVSPGARWEYDKDSTGQIFVIQRLDRETGETETLVGGPGGAIRPTPSPDGKLLAFVRRTPAFTSALWLRELASGREWPLYEHLDRDLQETDGSLGNTPAFAFTPNGKSIVFWAGGQIRSVDLASKAVREIPLHVRGERKVRTALRHPSAVAPDDVKVKMVRWARVSPDGQTVLFEALGQLWTRPLAGGAPRRLTTQSGRLEHSPSYTREGGVLYATWDDEALGTIRWISPGGAERVLLATPGVYVEPAMSPNGGLLAYRKMPGGYLLSGENSADPGIYLVELYDGQPKRIAKSGYLPHFSPDSKRVFFVDFGEGSKMMLQSVNLDGHDLRTHFEGTGPTEMRVSPDGRYVAFVDKWNAWIAPFVVGAKALDLAAGGSAFPVRQVSKRAGEFLDWTADSQSLVWTNGSTLYRRDLKDAFAHLAGFPEKMPDPVESGVELAFTVPADRPSGQIALVGGRVVTMRDARKTQEVIENGVVLVEGNRIAAVGARSAVNIPAGAKVVDVSGKTIVPGLVDVHAHGPYAEDEIVPEQNWSALSPLSFGVTTLHDPSNDTSTVFAAAERQRAGSLLAPRIFSTGTILYGAHAPGATAEIDTLDDALFHVRRLAEAGAISVKSYQQPRREQRQQVIEAGHQIGVNVVPEGGAKLESNLSEVVDGHTGIEHAVPVANLYDDVLDLWSGTQTGYTPTFVVAYGGLAGENYYYQEFDVWKDERLMAFVPRFVVEPRAVRRKKVPMEHWNHIQVARAAKKLSDRGVSIQIGAHGEREGLAAHWELWSLAAGGFSPWQAYRAGTIDGARYVGLDQDIGSIEKGKLADLAVIDGNPLENLQLSEKVSLVMLNGRLYDASNLSQILPERKDLAPLFFRKEGADTLRPATAQWLEQWQEMFGCRH